MKFDEKSFLEEFEKSTEKFVFLENNLIDSINNKMKSVKSQKYEDAFEWREKERFIKKIDLESVINEDRYKKISDILDDEING